MASSGVVAVIIDLLPATIIADAADLESYADDTQRVTRICKLKV